MEPGKTESLAKAYTKKAINPQSIATEISVLKNFDQSRGLDITNMLDIIEILALDIVSNSNKNDEVMNRAWNIGTMVKVLKEKLPNELFLSIEDLVSAVENEEAA
jgi:hypothetical protein